MSLGSKQTFLEVESPLCFPCSLEALVYIEKWELCIVPHHHKRARQSIGSEWISSRIWNTCMSPERHLGSILVSDMRASIDLHISFVARCSTST